MCTCTDWKRDFKTKSHHDMTHCEICFYFVFFTTHDSQLSRKRLQIKFATPRIYRQWITHNGVSAGRYKVLQTGFASVFCRAVKTSWRHWGNDENKYLPAHVLLPWNQTHVQVFQYFCCSLHVSVWNPKRHCQTCTRIDCSWQHGRSDRWHSSSTQWQSFLIMSCLL